MERTFLSTFTRHSLALGAIALSVSLFGQYTARPIALPSMAKTVRQAGPIATAPTSDRTTPAKQQRVMRTRPSTFGERGGGSDECGAATILTPSLTCNPVNASTVGATESLAPIECNAFQSTIADDVWFSFVANAVDLSIDVVGQGDFDAVVELFVGTCANLTSALCADETVGGETETMNVTGFTPGTTYLIRVYAYNGGAVDTDFTICVYGAGGTGPANDECAGATSLTPSLNCNPVNSTTLGATQSLDPIECNAFQSSTANDVWFSFVANAVDLSIDVTGTGDFDAILELFVGTCNNLTSALCADETVGGETETINATGFVPGTTYFARVYAYNGGAVDTDFTICVYGAGGTGPVNDLCSSVSAQPLALGGSLVFSGDNTGATIAGDYAPGSALEGSGFASVWHAFTTTACTNLTIEYCGTDPAFGNFFTALATSCPADEIILRDAFNFTDCGDGNITILYNDLPAGTYYIPVMLDPANSAEGPYSITLTSAPCGTTPANDECGGAVSLTPSATCNPTSGSISGATQSLDPIVCNNFESPEANDVWFSFVANATSLTIDVVGAGDLDAVVELFTGTCLAPTSVDCADATEGGELETINATGLVVGTTYRVRVYAFDGGGFDTDFEICVYGSGTVVAPENDLCGSVPPVPLAVGSALNFTGNNEGATSTGDFVLNSTLDTLNIPTVWHLFTTTECANVTVSYCGIEPIFGNVWVFLSPTCPAGDNVIFNTSNNETDCADGNFTILYTALPAGTYYLPVLTDPAAGASGPYSIEVSADACDLPPANDDCADAQELSIELPSNCPANEIVGNSTAAVLEPVGPDCDTSTNGFQDVWFSFNSLGNDVVDVNLTAGTITDLFIEVLDGCSGATVFCDLGSLPPYSVAVMPNTDYVIRAFSNTDFGAGGTFGICLSAAITSSVGEVSNTMTTVFPNPTAGAISFRNGSANGAAMVDVIDVTGRLLVTERIALTPNGVYELSRVAELASGTYQLRISTDQAAEVVTFVVE